MTSYLFVFGRTPDLAFLELAAFFPQTRRLTENAGIVEFPEDPDFQMLINKLGGTVKISKLLSEFPTVTAEILADALKTKDKKITFGLSSYSVNFQITSKLLSQIKSELENDGYSARFILGKNKEPLSSVVILKQKLTELIIVADGDKVMIGQTMVVQPFEAWNKRDYGRPFADPQAGMLPPKAARMVVNIAGFQVQPPILLDPFCGMGTILAEALLSGWQVIGSDQGEKMIDKTQKNLQWLAASYPDIEQKNWKLFASDATHVSEKLSPESIDAIVTEPFMGVAGENQLTKIKNTIKGLEKLYIGCLRDWQKILKPGGKVIIALPEYSLNERTFFVKKVIDNCEILGYTVITGPIEYGRPQAIVRRKFFVLRKIIS